MSEVHIYTLFRKPAALRMWEWRAILRALRPIWNTKPSDAQPARRLQIRWSPDKEQVIVESVFDREDLNLENKERLATYICNAANEANENPPQIGVDDDGNPVYDTAREYTVQQAYNAMGNMITLWNINGTWAQSGASARAYLAANAADWGGAEL